MKVMLEDRGRSPEWQRSMTKGISDNPHTVVRWKYTSGTNTVSAASPSGVCCDLACVVVCVPFLNDFHRADIAVEAEGHNSIDVAAMPYSHHISTFSANRSMHAAKNTLTGKAVAWKAIVESGYRRTSSGLPCRASSTLGFVQTVGIRL
jgi:hypothetical protein